MLAQMNTSWTDLFIVLGRKLTFFNGKFFSFLDQRIFFCSYFMEYTTYKA